MQGKARFHAVEHNLSICISIARRGSMPSLGLKLTGCNIQIAFASHCFHVCGLSLTKLSVLSFCWISFNLNHRRMTRKVLWSITVFIVACCLTSVFYKTLLCRGKGSTSWSRNDGPSSSPFDLHFALDLACYLVIYMIPVALFIRQILARSTAVTLTLMVGSLPVVTCIASFIFSRLGTGEENLICKSDTPIRVNASLIVTDNESKFIQISSV